MTAIPLGKGAYKRLDNPEIRLVNWFFEQSPTNVDDQVSLVARHGLMAYGNATPTGTCRGLRKVNGTFGNAAFGVWGEEVWNVFSNGTVQRVNLGGPGIIPGTAPVTIAMNATSGGGGGADSVALFAAGGQLYKSDGTSPVVMTFPDSANVTSVDIIASRFVAVCALSGRVYFSPPNTASFDPLDYFTAESRPDDLVRGYGLGDELWLVGEATIEVHVPSADPDLPFQRTAGRSFDIGCASRATMADIAGSMFFVGNLERRVFRTAPNPTAISDPGIDERLQRANAADLNGFTVQLGSHPFYVLNMGAQGSVAYDVSTGQWCEWASLNRADFRGRYATPWINGRYMIGDATSGVATFEPGRMLDYTAPMVRKCTGWLPSTAFQRCDNLILECSVGQGANYSENPVIALEMSDDRGKTWTDPETAPLGHLGDYDHDVIWTRLGAIKRRSPGRLFLVTCAEAVDVTIRALRFNEAA